MPFFNEFIDDDVYALFIAAVANSCSDAAGVFELFLANNCAILSKSLPFVSGTTKMTKNIAIKQNIEYIQKVPAVVISYVNRKWFHEIANRISMCKVH